jgi:hypothetical protein
MDYEPSDDPFGPLCPAVDTDISFRRPHVPTGGHSSVQLPIPGYLSNGRVSLWRFDPDRKDCKPCLATIRKVLAKVEAGPEKPSFGSGEFCFKDDKNGKKTFSYIFTLLAHHDAFLHPTDKCYYVPLPTLEDGSIFFWTVTAENSPTLFGSPLLRAQAAMCHDASKFWNQNVNPKLSLAAKIAQKIDQRSGKQFSCWRILSPNLRPDMHVAMFICNEHQVHIQDRIDEPLNHYIWHSFRLAIADPSKLIKAIQNGCLDVGFNINGWGIRTCWSVLDGDKSNIARDGPRMMFLMDVPDPDHRPVFLFAFDPTTGESLFTPPLGYACNHGLKSQPPQPFLIASDLSPAWWRALATTKEFKNSSLSSAFPNPSDPSDPEAMAARDYFHWSKEPKYILHAVVPGRRSNKQTEQGFSPTSMAIDNQASSSCSHRQAEISTKARSRTTQTSGKSTSRQSKKLHRESPSSPLDSPSKKISPAAPPNPSDESASFSKFSFVKLSNGQPPSLPPAPANGPVVPSSMLSLPEHTRTSNAVMLYQESPELAHAETDFEIGGTDMDLELWRGEKC